MIDTDGFRLNVGIILLNEGKRVFWAKRTGQEAWQFPQGGFKPLETPKRAMYRELYEEVGLRPEQIDVVSVIKGWLRYRLPPHLIRHHQKPLCIGQKQIWYLVRLNCDDCNIRFNATQLPEFDDWKWVDFWYPIEHAAPFKKEVYTNALKTFAPLVMKPKKTIIHL
jgi:putative (di)nucleoside polyphosphate hydrolase